MLCAHYILQLPSGPGPSTELATKLNCCKQESSVSASRNRSVSPLESMDSWEEPSPIWRLPESVSEIANSGNQATVKTSRDPQIDLGFSENRVYIYIYFRQIHPLIVHFPAIFMSR